MILRLDERFLRFGFHFHWVLSFSGLSTNLKTLRVNKAILIDIDGRPDTVLVQELSSLLIELSFILLQYLCYCNLVSIHTFVRICILWNFPLKLTLRLFLHFRCVEIWLLLLSLKGTIPLNILPCGAISCFGQSLLLFLLK